MGAKVFWVLASPKCYVGKNLCFTWALLNILSAFSPLQRQGVLSVFAAPHQGAGQGQQRVSQAPLAEHLTAPGCPLREGTDLSAVPWLCVLCHLCCRRALGDEALDLCLCNLAGVRSVLCHAS